MLQLLFICVLVNIAAVFILSEKASLIQREATKRIFIWTYRKEHKAAFRFSNAVNKYLRERQNMHNYLYTVMKWAPLTSSQRSQLRL